MNATMRSIVSCSRAVEQYARSALRGQLRRLGEIWRNGSTLQRRLAIANAGFIFLLIVYGVAWRSDALKYLIVLAGVTLAATVPELASKHRLMLRLVLLSIPALAIALVQILTDRDNDAKQLALSQQIETLQLGKYRDQIRDTEKERREGIDLDPRDTINAIKGADRGFISRADMLALHGAARQFRLTAAEPSLSDKIPPVSAEARGRLEAFVALKASLPDGSTPRSQSRAAIDEIIGVLQDEVAYRDVAEIFAQKIAPAYETWLSQNASGRSFPEMRESIWVLFGQVAPLVDRYDLAGVSNHLGMLAMASGHAEQALSQFYHGYERDHEHLPIYEALGYALWSVNDDAEGALRYATQGLAEAEKLRARLTSEAGEAMPAQQGTDFAKRMPAWVNFIERMGVRLRLQYAYFSALGVENEPIARKYGGELYASDKSDAEFQDAWGFVLMRFGGPAELDEAQRLFQAAIGNPSAEKITVRLADRHLKELQDLRRTLRAAPGAVSQPVVREK